MIVSRIRLTHMACALALMVTPVFTTAAQAELPYQTDWIIQTGTPGDDVGWSVAVDHAGHIYVSGTTEGSLARPNQGYGDPFLSKYDASGNILWSRQFGTNSNESKAMMTLDNAGNAYIAGYTFGDIGGPNAGGIDTYVRKYDPAGNLEWSKQFGTPSDDFCHAIAVDDMDNIYFTGSIQTHTGVPDPHLHDAYLTKLDPIGAEVWSRYITSPGYDISHSVALDHTGNVFISGYVTEHLGGNVPGDTDAFLTKYDPMGNELWTRTIDTPCEDYSFALAVDDIGNAYFGGYTQDTLDQGTPHQRDGTLIKYDPNGNELWSARFSTPGNDTVRAITLDDQGNPYITGQTSGNLAGQQQGNSDAYLMKLNTSGDILWSTQIGTSERDLGLSLTLDSAANVYLTGTTEGLMGGPSAGEHDAFLIKFVIPEPSTITLIAICGLPLIRYRM